jgi:hypothetical protein
MSHFPVSLIPRLIDGAAKKERRERERPRKVEKERERKKL